MRVARRVRSRRAGCRGRCACGGGDTAGRRSSRRRRTGSGGSTSRPPCRQAARWRRASGGSSRCRRGGTSRWGLAAWSITRPIAPAAGSSSKASCSCFPIRATRGWACSSAASRWAMSESPVYTSLLLRKDGSATVVRRAGGAVTPIADWAAVDGVKAHGGKDAEKHAFRIEADTATVTFLVDGTKVAATPRADVAADGHFGLRIGRGVNIHVVRLDFTQQLAPPRAPKPGLAPSSHHWSQGSGLDGTAVVPRVAGTANVLATRDRSLIP